MKSKWTTRYLEDVTTLITCGVAARPTYVPMGVPFLSAKNVKKGQIVWTDYKYISEKTHLALTKNNKPCIGDILYTRVGSFGEAAVIERDIDFSLFVSLTLIKPKREVLDPYFLKYFLNSPFVKKVAKESISSSGVGNLNVSKVRKFKISFPQLEEQKRIVSILDDVFTNVEKNNLITEKEITNTNNLFQAFLDKTLNELRIKDYSYTLEQVCTFENGDRGKNYPSKKYRTQTGIPFINAGHFNDSEIDFTHMDYIPVDRYAILSSGKVKRGDILFCLRGSLGKFAHVRTIDKGAIASSLVIIRPKEMVLTDFLLFYFRSNLCQEMIKKHAGGTAQPNLGAGDLKRFQIYIPSINMQKEIVTKLEEIDKETKNLRDVYKQRLDSSLDLGKSVLNKAFKGEL